LHVGSGGFIWLNDLKYYGGMVWIQSGLVLLLGSDDDGSLVVCEYKTGNVCFYDLVLDWHRNKMG